MPRVLVTQTRRGGGVPCPTVFFFLVCGCPFLPLCGVATQTFTLLQYVCIHPPCLHTLSLPPSLPPVSLLCSYEHVRETPRRGPGRPRAKRDFSKHNGACYQCNQVYDDADSEAQSHPECAHLCSTCKASHRNAAMPLRRYRACLGAAACRHRCQAWLTRVPAVVVPPSASPARQARSTGSSGGAIESEPTRQTIKEPSLSWTRSSQGTPTSTPPPCEPRSALRNSSTLSCPIPTAVRTRRSGRSSQSWRPPCATRASWLRLPSPPAAAPVPVLARAGAGAGAAASSIKVA